MRLALPLALLVPTALAASSPLPLPRVTFDARLLGLPATVHDRPAEKRGEDSLEFYAPRHVEATFGPENGNTLRILEVYPVAGLIAQYPGMRDGVRTEIGLSPFWYWLVVCVSKAARAAVAHCPTVAFASSSPVAALRSTVP